MKCVNEETERSKTCKSISLNLYFQKTFIVCLLFCYKVFDCRLKWLSSHSLVSRERTFRGLRQTRFAASLSLKTVFAAGRCARHCGQCSSLDLNTGTHEWRRWIHREGFHTPGRREHLTVRTIKHLLVISF